MKAALPRLSWALVLIVPAVWASCEDEPDGGSALLDRAREQLERRQYTEALTTMSALSSEELRRPEVRQLWARMYAGRAAIDPESVMEQVPTVTYYDQALGRVNFYDPVEYAVRLQDGRKALDLMTETPPSRQSAEGRRNLGLAASMQALRRVTAMLGGKNPAFMTNAEITQALSTGFAEHSPDLDRCLGLLIATKAETWLALRGPQGMGELAALDPSLTQLGFADGHASESELRALLLTASSESRRSSR